MRCVSWPMSISTRFIFITRRRPQHSDGFHQYDAQLEDFSRGAVDRETGDLQRFEGKFAAIPADQLDLTSQGDLELLLANIHGACLD